MAITTPVTELDARFSSSATPTAWAEALQRLKEAEVFWVSTVRPDGRPHVTPLMEGDARRVTDEATLRRVADAYESKYGRDWRFAVRDGAFHDQGGGEGAVALVYAVAPRKVLGFGKGNVTARPAGASSRPAERDASRGDAGDGARRTCVGRRAITASRRRRSSAGRGERAANDSAVRRPTPLGDGGPSEPGPERVTATGEPCGAPVAACPPRPIPGITTRSTRSASGATARARGGGRGCRGASRRRR